MTREEYDHLTATRPDIPGIMNERDRAWTLEHPSGARVSFTDYNQEITGHTENANGFPELGHEIHYGGNAYYVVGEAHRRGWTIVDHGAARGNQGDGTTGNAKRTAA